MLAQSGERQRSGKRRLREGKRGRQRTGVAREGFLDRRSKRCFWLLLSPQTKVARAGARNYPRRRQIMRLRRCGGESVSPLTGRRPPAATFLSAKKEMWKRKSLRTTVSGQIGAQWVMQIWRYALEHEVRWVTLSVQGIACTSCAAAADNSEGRGWYAGRFWRLSNRAHCGAKHRNG